VFQEEVLKKWLEPTDCALLARACWKCAEAVAASSGAGAYTRPRLILKGAYVEPKCGRV